MHREFVNTSLIKYCKRHETNPYTYFYKSQLLIKSDLFIHDTQPWECEHRYIGMITRFNHKFKKLVILIDFIHALMRIMKMK